MDYTIEVDIETDGRFIAEVLELPGVIVYGETQEEAIRLVKALALRVLADRLEHNEITPQLSSFSFVAA
jgi:predicted RNase H-like HicB family nuclease